MGCDAMRCDAMRCVGWDTWDGMGCVGWDGIRIRMWIRIWVGMNMGMRMNMNVVMGTGMDMNMGIGMGTHMGIHMGTFYLARVGDHTTGGEELLKGPHGNRLASIFGNRLASLQHTTRGGKHTQAKLAAAAGGVRWSDLLQATRTPIASCGDRLGRG